MTNKDYCARWKAKNKEKVKAYSQQYRLEHKQQHKDYENRRYTEDIQFRVKKLIRNRFYQAIRRNSKYTSVVNLIGCDIANLMAYLESRFATGMTWDNYGKWHIDHIKPCASFDLTKEAQQQECFHYTNLQPLWATDNIKKKDNYE